jgi:zinc/manganese transport system permease protein
MSVSFVALGYQHNWWQILSSGFMRNALVGGTVVALAAGLIGYFIIVRNNAFAAHARGRCCSDCPRRSVSECFASAVRW